MIFLLFQIGLRGDGFQRGQGVLAVFAGGLAELALEGAGEGG